MSRQWGLPKRDDPELKRKSRETAEAIVELLIFGLICLMVVYAWTACSVRILGVIA
jgi:hypothetical protein